MKKVFLLLIVLIPNLLLAQHLGAERVKRIKESVVRVLIENEPSGTAFFISKDGRLASSWHVIEPAMIRDSTTNRIVDVKKISIEFSSKERIRVDIPLILIEKYYNDAIAFDFVLLIPDEKPKTDFSVLRLGDFNNCKEGDYIYSIGYPLGIEQSIISTGIMSSKWKDTIQIQNSDSSLLMARNVAWLDLTMNKGNSGGPIIRLGKTPDEDEVIGIATFILNPFAQDASKLAEYLRTGEIPDLSIGGLSNNKIHYLFAKAIANNSIGVSGCISINHLLNILITDH